VLLVRGHAQIIVQICFALIIGASLQRAHAALERTLERTLFRRLRHAEIELSRAAAAVPNAASRDAVEALLTDAPVAALDLEFAGAYRREKLGGFARTRARGDRRQPPDGFAAQEPFVQILAAGSLPPAIVEGAVALPVGDGGSAFVLYGPHRNGLALDPDEIGILRDFTAQAGPTYRALAERAARATELAGLLRAPESLDREFSLTLAAHILAELSREDYELLAACIVIPEPTADDVAFVAGSPRAHARLAELAATAFLSRTVRGTFAVHPLLAPVLATRFAGSTREAARRCAEWCGAHGRHLRSAELYAAAGDRSRALAALAAELRLVSGEEARFATVLDGVLASAPTDEAAAYPELLLARALRVLPIINDAALRAATFRAIERDDGDPDVRRRLAVLLAYSYAEAGELGEAAALIERFDASGGSSVGAIIAGKRGRLAECEALARRCEERIGTVAEGLPAPSIVRAAYVERARGGWLEAGALADLTLARDLGTASRGAALADAAFTGWLAGGEHSCDDDDAVPVDAYPRFAAQTWLVRACRAGDRVEAQLLARLALDASRTAREPFVSVVALVCLHELGGRRQVEHLADAAELAERIESTSLRASVATLIGGLGDCGMLQPVVSRIRANLNEAAVLAVDTATACVRRGSETVSMPERELALMLALAQSSRPHASATLIDALWPGLDEANGVKALQTCVYRVRLRLGDATVIVSVAQGYQLSANVFVDLWEAERFLTTLRDRGGDDSFVRLRLQATARHFGAHRPASTREWEWFDPTERRVTAVAREARRLLAEQHLRAGEHAPALSYAREMISVDELDEGAREIAIRVHLAADDVTEAWRELRLYREALARESDDEVPAALSSLLPALGGDEAAPGRAERPTRRAPDASAL
jgi:DNA-binding SARP family transcriptional activator